MTSICCSCLISKKLLINKSEKNVYELWYVTLIVTVVGLHFWFWILSEYKQLGLASAVDPSSSVRYQHYFILIKIYLDISLFQ